MANDRNIDRRTAEDRQSDGIGGIVDEVASSRIVGDALNRIVDAGESVMRAQQSAFSALGLPSGSQFESLTLRVRTLFHRIEELEDELDRLDARIAKLESAAASAKKPAAKQARARKTTQARTPKTSN